MKKIDKRVVASEGSLQALVTVDSRRRYCFQQIDSPSDHPLDALISHLLWGDVCESAAILLQSSRLDAIPTVVSDGEILTLFRNRQKQLNSDFWITEMQTILSHFTIDRRIQVWLIEWVNYEINLINTCLKCYRNLQFTENIETTEKKFRTRINRLLIETTTHLKFCIISKKN